MSEGTTLDLSTLPPPEVVEALSFQEVFRESLSTLITLMPDFSALLESDPAIKILETGAYRELIVRQRANDSALATMLAYAQKGDLDQIAARYNLNRYTLAAEDLTTVPPTPAVMESDTDFRRRIQLQFESLSVAGPAGAYRAQAGNADPRVKDAGVSSPIPGYVVVSVLSREGDGTASADLLSVVEAHLRDDDVRPLTDFVTVESAKIIPFSIDADLTLYPGPDGEVVRATALAALAEYLEKTRRIGLDVARSGIYGALHQEGVQSVRLNLPSSNVIIGPSEAAQATSIDVRIGGRGE